MKVMGKEVNNKMQCEHAIFALMKVWWMTRIFGELLTLSRSSPLSAASFLSNFWRRSLQKFNHQICCSPRFCCQQNIKTLSEWWEDGTGPITFHAQFNGQWDFFQQKWSLLLFYNNRFILFERQFVPLKSQANNFHRKW